MSDVFRIRISAVRLKNRQCTPLMMWRERNHDIVENGGRQSVRFADHFNMDGKHACYTRSPKLCQHDHCGDRRGPRVDPPPQITYLTR